MTVPEAAIEATAIHLFQVDRRLKGLTPVDWKYATDFERAYFRAEAVLALEAALPAIREALAQEIEANTGGHPIPAHRTANEHHTSGMNVAARIVRGGTP